MKQLTADQFNWMYKDYKPDDDFVYAVNYEKVDGRKYVIGVTKSVGCASDFMNDDYWAGQVQDVYTDCMWTEHASTFGATFELMTTCASKTNRARKSYDATVAWLQKLPLNERVEL